MNDKPKEMTVVRFRVLRAIIDFKDKNFYYPTMVELGDLLGTERQNIHKHIKNLIREGFLKKTEEHSRSYEVTDKVAQLVDDEGRVNRAYS